MKAQVISLSHPQQILDQSTLPLNFLVFGGVSAACMSAPVNPADTYLVGSIPIKARIRSPSTWCLLWLTLPWQRPHHVPSSHHKSACIRFVLWPSPLSIQLVAPCLSVLASC